MVSACAGSLLAELAQVPDPRGRKGRRHPLSAMLTAVVCGLLCGNRSYSALVEWLHDLPVDVWHWMGYTRRPPKLDCFRDLLMKLDPDVLERLLTRWITEVLGLVWDEATLIKYLAKPLEFMPGTKMAYAGLSDEADRKDVIAYLKSVK